MRNAVELETAGMTRPVGLKVQVVKAPIVVDEFVLPIAMPAMEPATTNTMDTNTRFFFRSQSLDFVSPPVMPRSDLSKRDLRLPT